MVCFECGDKIEDGDYIIRVSSGEFQTGKPLHKKVGSLFFHAGCYTGYDPEKTDEFPITGVMVDAR